MPMMEVLLREDIDNLGARGELVKVRAGYGRNYLLPRGLAVLATASNVKQIELQRKALLKRAAVEHQQAAGQAELLKDVVLEFARKVGEHGILFGSVTSMDIAAELAAKGFEIERRRIQLKDPIKEPGDYDVPVKLHREVTAQLKVVVRDEAKVAPAAEPATASESAAEA
jgi:large subunit ribosomal protein L9